MDERAPGPALGLLADVGAGPVADAFGEHPLNARPLGFCELDRAVRSVERLQPALQEVVRERAAGDHPGIGMWRVERVARARAAC